MRLTERLRLEPVGPEHAEDLWRIHSDAGVAEWHGGAWTRDEARRRAAAFREAWDRHGVDKWIAYDRRSGELIGRGGLSRMESEAGTTGQIRALVRRDWDQLRLEVGWTLRAEHWGRGYATEIGRAGLAFAFDELAAGEVVAFTEVHNARSRAVMERLGMSHVGEITHYDAPFVLYSIVRSSEGWR